VAESSVDVLIVGAGPVGLFGAYYAGARGLSTAVLDSLPEPGGQITAMYPEKAIFDVAGFPAIRGRELVSNLVAQAAPFSPGYLLGQQAIGLERGDDFVVTTTAGDRVRAKAIIVTGGIGTFTPRPLPTGEELLGHGVVHFVPKPDEYSGLDVVIVGGGFAGLYLARDLARVPVRVTLIDRTNHHLFQPMLYQVATAALSAPDISYPIRSVVRRQGNTDVLLGEVVSVGLASREVVLSDGHRLGYDYLVLAPGARHSYFSHPEWELLAPGLKNLEDAGEVRRRILLAFERAEREADPVARQRCLTFVVVGGGPTGVEVAGAIAELARFALRRDFRRIDSRDATILLLEGGPRLLSSYPARLSDRAKQQLRRLGVDVRTETFVTDVEPGYVQAAGWRIPTDTVIWAAGNQASPLLRTLGVSLDSQGRVLVQPDCTIPGHPEVFVLGDAAAYAHQPGYAFLPWICPAAIQMGHHAARVIKADLAAKPRQPFRYHNKGQLAVIGRARAVADLPWIKTSGLSAWLLWVFVHIFFLIGFRNRVIVLFEWAWSYLTFQRGARVITGQWQAEQR